MVENRHGEEEQDGHRKAGPMKSTTLTSKIKVKEEKIRRKTEGKRRERNRQTQGESRVAKARNKSYHGLLSGKDTTLIAELKGPVAD